MTQQLLRYFSFFSLVEYSFLMFRISYMLLDTITWRLFLGL